MGYILNNVFGLDGFNGFIGLKIIIALTDFHGSHSKIKNPLNSMKNLKGLFFLNSLSCFCRLLA